MARLRKSGRTVTLSAIRPNAGLRAAYRKRLLALVDEMTASYDHWLKAQYRKHEPEMLLATDAERRKWAFYTPTFDGAPWRATPGWVTMDASPAKELERELRKLAKRWIERFDEAAEDMARYFAKAAHLRSDRAMKSILKRGGWTVDFKMTMPMRDVLNATIEENVGLIKSIPTQFHTQVQGMVMRSVTAGRDLATLSDELSKSYGITRRRAEFIARDQNNKMTANFTRVRQVEMGITEAIWLHSAAGRKPRPTHVRNSGKRYDVAKGWYDPAVKQYIWPGVLPNCRCVSKPIVKGFS